MLSHPSTVFGLGDGGAHVQLICDASAPTILIYDVLHRSTDALGELNGDRSLEWAVWKQTGSQAELYGLRDRGLLERGRKADINVIDLDRLALRRPEIVYDLPGGNAARLIQRAEGYVLTMVNGEVAFRDGLETGSRTGVLIRHS
jgi:N-acyl-D-aspartate/D-glutamate deacylase